MSSGVLSLSDLDHGRVLTREEFAQADYAEPFRYERHAGRLVVIPPATYEHHKTLEPIRNLLVVYSMGQSVVVKHVFQGAWTAIDAGTDRCPDIAVYLNTDEKHGQRIPGRIPDLAFEIVSQGWVNRKRDFHEKRGEYERMGVLEYVIVDQFDHQVTVLKLGKRGYGETVLNPSDTYTSPLMPGLEIPLQEVIDEPCSKRSSST
jgi:Uma2 family endonuclease